MHLDVRVCCDCSCPGAQWVSVTQAVFLCDECASIHRDLPNGHNLVKNLVRDSLTERENQALGPSCNDVASSRLDSCLPLWYYVPKPSDCLALKQEWIHCRYAKLQFTTPELAASAPFAQIPFSCHLYKKSRDSSSYQLKQFILSENDGMFRYCSSGKKLTTSYKILETNACFIPEKMGKSNGLQIVVPHDGSIRNLFVYTDMSEDVVNFFQALRCAKFHLLQSAYPEARSEELCSQLTIPFPKEGWLHKATAGATRLKDSFRKRWFTLHGRYLYYFDGPLSPTPKGRIFLGHRDMGYYIHKGFLTPLPATKQPSSSQSHSASFNLNGSASPGSCSSGVGTIVNGQQLCGFTIVTPSRDHVLTVESEVEGIRWTEALDVTVNEKIPPKDLARYRQMGENV